jgi:hypothetical protein
MKKPNGELRLVALSVWDRPGVAAWGISAYPIVFIPGTLTREAHAPANPSSYARFSHENCTIYWGQIDPADSTHFTLDLTLSGAKQTYDGWLHDDDTVTLEER